jgi:predicted HTH transcriptional regulator
MNWNDILDNIRKGNTETSLFISQVTTPEDLGPQIVALATHMGGKIIIGIDLINYHLIGTTLCLRDKVLGKSIGSEKCREGKVV